MATVTVQDLITQARVILQDRDAVRWADEEFLGWVASAYREIVRYRPAANSVTQPFTAINGTRQSLPVDGAYLISVVRNETGTLRSILPIERTILDSQNPDWHTVNLTNGSVDPRFYVYEKDSPKVFYLYPAATAGDIVSIQYARIPTAHTVKTETISLDDTYAGTIVDYMLYRAYSKDASVGDQHLAQRYGMTFYQQIGGPAPQPAASAPRAVTTA
jgi:hypothetical protein